MKVKLCKTCRVEKPLGEFYKSLTCSFGVESNCKDCKYKATVHYRNRVKSAGYVNDGHLIKVCINCGVSKSALEYSRIIGNQRVSKCKSCYKEERRIKIERLKSSREYASLRKKCTACSEEKTLDKFSKQDNALYGVSSQCKLCDHKHWKDKYVAHPRIVLTEKSCSRCKETYPATKEFFYTKITKADSITGKRIGLKTDCIIYRHVCKNCHGLLHAERRRKKRMQELGVSTLEEYNTIWREQIGQKNRKYPDSPKEANARTRYYNSILTPSYIALNLRLSVNDLTPELLESSRKVIKTKRICQQLKQNKSLQK
jgi:hypothetical protein